MKKLFFEEWLKDEKKFRFDQLRQAIFHELVENFSEISVFSEKLRKKLSSSFDFSVLKLEKIFQEQKTEKAILESKIDQKKMETVLLRHQNRTTVCVSTQIGCACGCKFCETGKMGLIRNLSSREIVEQVLFWSRKLKKEFLKFYPEKKWNLQTAPPEFRVRNIVFMGMGEPLQNLENVKSAIEIFDSSQFYNLGIRRITISTCGIISGIEKIMTWKRVPNLAISLHAADENLRSELLPINKKFPLKKLIPVLEKFSQKTKKRIFLQWTLIQGKNDSVEQMKKLGEKFTGKMIHVNFIPVNPGKNLQDNEKFLPPEILKIRKLQKFLEDHFSIPSTIRNSHGQDFFGACGQLSS